MTLEEELFARHRGKGIVLDSNLLLVFLSGAQSIALFGRFKRLGDYTVGDYDLLVRLLDSFRTLVLTPHILTEVSNLANSLPESSKEDWYRKFAALLTLRSRQIAVQEKWVPAAELAAMPEFVPFGITDTALAQLSPEALVVTEDYRLSGALRKRGIPVLNFGDLRKLRLFAND
jgi:hypothetical protein